MNVARRLINLSVVFALVTGCWGGVLAAAACPHVECETTAAAPEGAAGHGHDAATSEDHSGHAGEHGGHPAEPPAQNTSEVGRRGLPNVSPGGHDLGCTHCVGSPEAPPSPTSEAQANSVRKGAESAAPTAVTRVEAPAAVFLREITPAQHAPPHGTVRHLLLSVFRI
jgi:hypothetical protein